MKALSFSLLYVFIATFPINEMSMFLENFMQMEKTFMCEDNFYLLKSKLSAFINVLRHKTTSTP